MCLRFKRFIARGAKVNAKDKSGWTALMLASQSGKLEVVKVLTDKGRRRQRQANNDSITALMIASQDGHSEIVKALLDKGAEVDAVNKDDWTALMTASWNGHRDVVEALLARRGRCQCQEQRRRRYRFDACLREGQRRGRAGAACQWGRCQRQRQGGSNRVDACLTVWPPRRRAGPARRERMSRSMLGTTTARALCRLPPGMAAWRLFRRCSTGGPRSIRRLKTAQPR